MSTLFKSVFPAPDSQFFPSPLRCPDISAEMGHIQGGMDVGRCPDISNSTLPHQNSCSTPTKPSLPKEIPILVDGDSILLGSQAKFLAVIFYCSHSHLNTHVPGNPFSSSFNIKPGPGHLSRFPLPHPGLSHHVLAG